MVGVFIKTCKKDHDWLKYCLQSIEQNAREFEGVCILTDEDHDNIFELKSIVTTMPVSIVQVARPENIVHRCQNGVDYIWMQSQKLLWHNYCSFSQVLQIDSDCIIMDTITPDKDFKVNNKFKWWTRNWKQSGPAIVHYLPLRKMFGIQPKHEHMLFNGWILDRESTVRFHNWLQETHGCDIWEYILNKTNEDWGEQEDRSLGRGFSVYNAYGVFIEQLFPDKYVFVEGFVDMPPIKQYWSYGGISEKIQEEIEMILSL